MQPRIDVQELRSKVRNVYRQVAHRPGDEFHFETGRPLAEKLGYGGELDEVPAEAIASFAGVGYHFDLAGIREGEAVLDLGSGSGMDSFIAALHAGPNGRVVGIDMTDEQLEKAESLRRRHGFEQVRFERGLAEDAPVDDGSYDVVISNGVINLAADKGAVFREIARALRPGGRMAISDIVTEVPLTDDIVCDTSLWAACIGGAAQQDGYREAIETAGLDIVERRVNPQYAFLSKSAQGATKQFGVKSVSLLARRG
jgi:arsenite methyltransferase